jgi:ubiquinone/menaquinone biosynthesis C-methylase UbiE
LVVMTTAADAEYLLGHDEAEQRRLLEQAAIVEPLTRRSLLAAGLEPGMHVLDVGSGFGDVSVLASDLVGPAGSVVGIDREPSAVASATARATALGATNVR